jgi:hypothetical protein
MPSNIRVLNGNIGPRSTYKAAKIPWESRKKPLMAALTGIKGGLPGAMVFQECTRPMQVFLMQETGYVGFGNGINPRTRLDVDRSGDNVAILYDPDEYSEDGRRIVWAGVLGGIGRTYTRAIKLRRKGTTDSFWLATTHPPAGSSYKTLRMKHARTMAKLLNTVAGGIDLKDLVWGGDWNDPTPYPERGVRTLLENEFKLRDIERLLSADAFEGNSTNSSHGFKPTRHTGRKIDFIVIGGKIRARYARMIRTDVAPNRWACDHNLLVAGLTI